MLLEGKCLAISVQNFMDQRICAIVSKALFKQHYEYYTYAQDSVGRYGTSFSEVGENLDMFSKYYSNSNLSVETIRQTFAPYLSPIDKLRLELDEKWPQGAMLESFDPGQKMFVGLCRVIDAEKEVFPHQDVIQFDAKGKSFVKASQIINQLAVNIYLQMPQHGGELELWDFGIKDVHEYQKMAENSYGIHKSKLPNPALIIKPKVGELILFCSQRLHCIFPGSEKRLTMSSFIGYRGKNFPLTYWS